MTVQQHDHWVSPRLTRRKALALGAAGVVTAALSACGNGIAATATGASGTVAAASSTVQAAGGTVQAAVASQVPGGAGGVTSTIQAVASQNPGIASTAQAAVTQVAGMAPVPAGAGGDPANRNNKYQGKPPAMTIDKTKKYVATIVTNKGTMKAELYADTAPISVNNFAFLANDHFYDNVIFHRIVKGFVIQGGDPTGLGTGGPGYKFMDESTSFTRNYEKGTLAMANSGRNTNGSQFFICFENLTARGMLPKNYSIFGKVTSGMDVLDRMAQVQTGAGDRPVQNVTMNKVIIEAQ